MRRSLRLYFKPFSRMDLGLFDIVGGETHTILESVADLERLAAKGIDSEYGRHCCITAMIDGKPLYIAGYYEHAPGAVTVFLVPDKRIRQYPKAFVFSAKRWISWIEGFDWCNRIQATSLPVKLIDRWMEALGFVCEDTLNGYTEAGQDYKLWSRVKLNGVWQAIQSSGPADGLQQ